MLSILHKRKNKKLVLELANTIRLAAREPVFYTAYGVPDTRQGRLDLLIFQLCILSAGLAGHAGGHRLAQPVFDAILRDIQESLRQIGVGDLSVPHKMKAIMRAANGLSDLFYKNAENAEVLVQAIQKNLYHGQCEDKSVLNDMVSYVQANMAALAQTGGEGFAFTLPERQAA